MPVFINKDHFLKNKTCILNALTVIKFGPKGEEKYDFKPEYVFEVLPSLLSKMIIYLLKEQPNMNEPSIRCYCHYILLMNKTDFSIPVGIQIRNLPSSRRDQEK